MKKSYSLFSCVAMFLLALVLCCKPVKAAEPKVINLSDLEEGQTLELQEDTILNLDTEKRLSQIHSTGYDLSIEGSGTLIIDDNEQEYNIGIFLVCNAKMVMNSGTIISNESFSGSFVINGGIIKNEIPNAVLGFFGTADEYFTLNGGNVYTSTIEYNEPNAEITINNGHLECSSIISCPNIYISDDEFVVAPWNGAPYDFTYVGGKHVKWLENVPDNLKIIPKSEVKFLSGISLSENSITLNQYESKQLAVNFAPEDAMNKNITWSSSDELVASANPDGRVTAYKSGSAVITATSEDGSFTASCEITVPDTNISPDTGNSSDGLVIEISSQSNAQSNQGDIKVTYKGYKLKEGVDYVINRVNDLDTGLSTTKIIGIDKSIYKYDQLR